MWILGNLLSNNPTILYTIGDKDIKKKNKNTIMQGTHKAPAPSVNAIEDIEHIKKYFGIR